MLLVGIRKHSKWVKEAERGLGIELQLEGIKCRGGLAKLGGGKVGVRTDEEGRNVEVNVYFTDFFENVAKGMTSRKREKKAKPLQDIVRGRWYVLMLTNLGTKYPITSILTWSDKMF